MANGYGKMMDAAYGSYYERFRALGAVSEDKAVERKQLFPHGEDLHDAEVMHKMLSSGIVKRVGMNHYWLDEELVSNPGVVLKQRLLVVLAAFALAGVLLLLNHFGIIHLS